MCSATYYTLNLRPIVYLDGTPADGCSIDRSPAALPSMEPLRRGEAGFFYIGVNRYNLYYFDPLHSEEPET